MKRTIQLMIAAILVAAFSANAQDDPGRTASEGDYRQRLQLGLKLGTNYSSVIDSEGEEFRAEAKFGWAGGFFVAIPFGKFVGLQPEVLFSQKGFKAKGRILGGGYELVRTTSYIDIPLLVTFKPASFLTILAGPQYSYLIRQNDEFRNATSTIAQEQEFENDNPRKNTFCLVYGIDINFNHIVVGGRIAMDLLENHGDGSSSTPRYRNAWGQVTLGYRFYEE